MKLRMENSRCGTFIIRHDVFKTTHTILKVIVFDCVPVQVAGCTSTLGLVSGINKFLKLMDIIFRQDQTNYYLPIDKRIQRMNKRKNPLGITSKYMQL